MFDTEQIELPLKDETLPLDNLDANFICGDALFVNWPESDVVVSNPPYQSKNKIQRELGRGYISRVRAKYPTVDGRADYCVYWFMKTHNHLQEHQRAGLVGTNTIRQNYSRKGGLDYIVAEEGTITDAVSTMKWSGDANVDVSIVNWVKGNEAGQKRLYRQDGNNPALGWSVKSLEKISASLSFETDVTSAVQIRVNSAKGGCFQGQTHGHAAFLLSKSEAVAEVTNHPASRKIIFPYLIANDLLSTKDGLPKRYVLDLQGSSVLQAQSYKSIFKRLEKLVLPEREKAAFEEQERNTEASVQAPGARPTRHHAGFLNRWWVMSYPREDMVSAISKLRRYIGCGRVAKRPVFEFIDSAIRPSDLIMVFPYEDDYSFGILQSSSHWVWFRNQCSTLTGRPRYTSNSVFDTFPWPQTPSFTQVSKVARAAVAFRNERNALKTAHGLSFRNLYRSMERPGKHPLKIAQDKLDDAVRSAYGMPKRADMLDFLLTLNKAVALREATGLSVCGPGLPATVPYNRFVTGDKLTMPPI